MKEITFEINSNQEIWTLIDKNYNHILIHKFMPNESFEWWKTEIKMKNKETYDKLEVRNMEFDILTDLKGLKKILDQNTRQLRIYQFDKPISNTLSLDNLPQNNRNQILLQNGLKHFYFINFEFITISSSNDKFIKDIEDNDLL